MKPLSRLQSLAFTLGGLLLLVGALLPMVPSLSDFAPYVFCAGALLFGTLQLVQRYEGRNVTVRRLRRQQMLGRLPTHDLGLSAARHRLSPAPPSGR